ncbi:hypothetical protein LIA77_00462 [Sarocladium implicatum]|nr:hypothetical protein LIA77_00462 [Sarocladium implicatum]
MAFQGESLAWDRHRQGCSGRVGSPLSRRDMRNSLDPMGLELLERDGGIFPAVCDLFVHQCTVCGSSIVLYTLCMLCQASHCSLLCVGTCRGPSFLLLLTDTVSLVHFGDGPAMFEVTFHFATEGQSRSKSVNWNSRRNVYRLAQIPNF